MAKNRVSRQQLASAMQRAGGDASPEKIASFYLAPTLAASELGTLCSFDFLTALAEQIERLERIEKNNEKKRRVHLSLDPNVIKAADKIFCRMSPFGGVVGLVVGAIIFGALVPPYGFIAGIFFPGVIFCIALSSVFQDVSFSNSQSIKNALSMAYGVHLAAKENADHWRSLTWRNFEKEVATLFQDLGFVVTLTPGSGDKGVDLFIARHPKKMIVQCKQYSKAVGPNFVRELLGTLVRHGSDAAILIATSGFTDAAFQAAFNMPIILLDLNDILEIQRTHSLDTHLKI